MRIVVLVKEVPDTWSERRLDVASGRIDRAGDVLLDEVSERALEVALSVKDKDKRTEVVVLTMGPEGATASLRKCLAMGADSAVHISDAQLVGADSIGTARVLAAALRRMEFDLVIAGNESTDGRGGVVPAMLAELLSLPHATFLSGAVIAEGAVRGERATDDGALVLEAELPAIVSITERNPDARFPSFRGTMTAKKKPIENLSLAQLALDAAPAVTVVDSAARRPARQAGDRVVDDGTAAQQLVDFLAAKRLI